MIGNNTLKYDDITLVFKNKEELKLIYPQNYSKLVDTYSKKYNISSSVIYALIRSRFSKLQSIRMSGKNNPMYGHACTEFMS